MIPNMEELYKPYSKDANLMTSLLYWKKEGRKLRIPEDVIMASVTETFVEIANGKKFPIGTCDCGCDFPVEWSCVALNHYVLKKMVDKNKDIQEKIAHLMQDDIEAGMLSLIKKQNREYIEAHTPKPGTFSRFFGWIMTPCDLTR